jgi:GcrA cell cycle regulator
MIVPWTQEQIGLLRKFYNEGRSFSIIADMINGATGSSFTRNAVIGRANRLGDLSPRVRGRAPSISRIRRARTPSLVPVTPPPPKPVRGDFLHIPFLELEPNHCRFPQGEGLTATYCGQPKKEGSAYCAYCHSICYGRDPEPIKFVPKKLAA